MWEPDGGPERRLGHDPTSGVNNAHRANAMPVDQAMARLKALPLDPLSVKYSGLPPVERASRITEERKRAAGSTSTTGG